MRKFSLSPHTLNLYSDCPRCFWFHMIKGASFKRPSPPTSTLPSGMDNLIKKYFDHYRKKNSLPPEMAKITRGQLVEENLIKKWRWWKTGLEFIDKDGSRLSGALDECLITNDIYVPVDYKTRGFDLKEDSTSYYILQMSCYSFLLAKNKYKTSDYAYLVFYIPKEVEAQGVVNFNVIPIEIKTYPHDKVYKIFREAIELLSLKNPPPKDKDCKFCDWAQRVQAPDQGQKQLKLF